MCRTRISVGLMINAGMLLDSSKEAGGPVIAPGLTGKSLSRVNLASTQRPSVSLVSDTRMFL